MSNQIEQIRAEIERRKKVNLEEGETGWTCVDEDDEILHFIDQLPAQLVTAEVQEAAEKYDEKATEIALKTTSPFQEELTGPAPTYSDAFEAGAEWQRERLLAGAIKTNIFDIEDGTDAAKLIVSIPGAKTGDKVYIITENTEAAPGAPLAFEHRILGRADVSSCCD